MSIDWNKVTSIAGGDFVRFDAVGDGVEGVIVASREASYPNEPEKIYAQFDIRTATGSIKTWTVSITDAIRKVTALRPKVGDTIRATFVGNYRTAAGQGKTIEIEHTPGQERKIA